MLAELFLSVADAVISYTIDKLDPAETLKTWLKRDPAKLAFQKALARTYAAFARQYPEYAASLFDQSFLSKEAIPEISKLLIRSQHPDPALLAQAWGTSIGFDLHSEFCKQATKPASDFLAWLEAELKAEQAFQALFDSRALDSLPRIEAEIGKLTKELTRGLDAALKIAGEYEKISINIGGDVKDSNIIIGDNNVINKYYYSGDFVSLNEYYIPPDGVFQRVDVDKFIGRDWLTTKVDAFLIDPNRKSGAFLLIGEAGVGKTSFMAHLVKERRYLHLFAEQAPGQAMLQRAMQSLGSQLVTRYQIAPYKDRDTLNALSVFPDFLERLLRLAASTLTEGEKIVIVCDALDEAGVFPDHFVFGLPKELPDGVYFILSQRPVNVKLPNFEPVIEKLEAQGEANLQDIESYLSAVSKRPEVAGQIRSKEYSEDFFIQILKEKSQGVWMYLHYIIEEIESGSRAPLDLENLPTGLVGYYTEYWDTWRTGKRGKGEEAWDELYAPLLTTLAAAQEAISIETLIQWAGVTVTLHGVTRLLSESWRAFITEKEVNGKRVYAPYHLSFKDFITGRVDITKLPPAQANLVKDLAVQTVDAHKRIVNAFEKECSGEWEKLVQQEYPCLHLSIHLAGAEEYEKLQILLTEGDEKIKWADAKEKKEETYAGYFNDLTYVWDYAEREQNYALAIRCMLIENSIHSLAANIPPKLLTELVIAGVWSYTRCLDAIRQHTDPDQQAMAIKLIASSIPSHLLENYFLTSSKIKDEGFRAYALIGLVPYLNEELKTQVLSVVRKIKSEYIRATSLIDLASHFNENLKTQLLHESLYIISEIKDEPTQARAIAYLAPNLNDEARTEALVIAGKIKDKYARARALTDINHQSNENLTARTYVAIHEIKDKNISYPVIGGHHFTGNDKELSIKTLQESLIAAREIKDEPVRIKTLVPLTSYLNEDIKVLILQKALTAAREIKDKPGRVQALLSLAPYLNTEIKTQVLQESFVAAREIDDKSSCSHALLDVALNLNEGLKTQALQESLTAAREIKDKSIRAKTLTDICPFLSKELKTQALQESFVTAREIENEEYRAHALMDLVPYLNEELRAQVFSVVLEIKDEPTRAFALTVFTPQLTDELKTQVFSAAQKIKAKFDRASALVALAPHLNEKLKSHVLSIIREFKDESVRVRALVALAPFLNEELHTEVLQEALITTYKIEAEYDRARILAKIGLHFNKETKTTIFQNALYIYTFDFMLIEIINQWKKFDFSGLEKEVVPFIKFTASKSRKKGMEIIDGLTPALIHFRGPDIVPELYRAIMDTARWWP